MSSQRRKVIELVLAGGVLIGAVLFFWWQIGGNLLDPDAKVDAVFKKHGGSVVRDEGKPGRPITWIRFSGNILTDDGLQELIPQLKELKKLRDLDLAKTKVTDAGLQHLAGLRLAALTVPLQARTDLGLKHYIEIVEPEIALNLDHWSITDAGLKELAGLKKLKTLDLSHTDITDAGLKELTGLKFKLLVVPEQARTDLGLKYFLALVPPQKRLILANWKITDASVPVLAKQTTLVLLDISGTKITSAGVKELQKTLPKCKIQR